MDVNYKTQIEFRKGDQIIRSHTSVHDLHGICVGESIMFDHPQIHQCMSGKVTKVSHVVFLGDGHPLTYIDVEVTSGPMERDRPQFGQEALRIRRETVDL